MFMKVVLMIFLLWVNMACNTQQKKSYSGIEEDSEEMAVAILQDHPGKLLMENNCYVCHSPKASEQNMIAPPMVAVKMHYLSSEISKEDFIEEVVLFLKNPSEEKSKMPGAVKKFGLMPYQFYPENTIRQIADYMFDYEMAQPEWFEDHYNKMQRERPQKKGGIGRAKGMGMGRNQTNTSQQLSIEERGMQIAQSTKAELGKNLMGQIQKNGVIAALEFCNIEAMPLTDSMSVVHKAHIKRVSDKPRNPNNKADAMEVVHIKTFKEQVASGKEPTPIITTTGEKVQFYYPIVTNSMCLKCHGTPGKELEKLTMTNILNYYQADKATGYGENEVRGIWRIEFEK